VLLQAAAPPALVAAVKRAADREFMSLSEYIRRSLVERLRASGIDPAGQSETARGH
jgi:hypothetical protein